MATIGEMLGEARVKELVKSLNPNFNIPRMVEPKKEDKLAEDLKWIDYHMAYVDSVKRIFNLGLQYCPASSQGFIYLNTPVLIDAHVDQKFAEKFPLTFLGYHVNGTLLSVPSFIVPRDMVYDHMNRCIDYKMALEVINSLRNERGEITLRSLIRYNPYVGSLKRSDVMEEVSIARFLDQPLSTIEDLKRWKQGVSWVNPTLGRSVKIAGEMYAVFPLMPEATRDNSTRIMHNGRSSSQFWSFIK